MGIRHPGLIYCERSKEFVLGWLIPIVSIKKLKVDWDTPSDNYFPVYLSGKIIITPVGPASFFVMFDRSS